ncbi:MAG: hypothetical protein KDA96_14180, partial [Planctomycetaceae bacterium]|nr:hypothetical protein [Planctomycetaceae bacterium]
PLRIDADQHKDLVRELNVKLPTILVVGSDLTIMERITGYQDVDTLQKKLAPFVRPATFSASVPAQQRPVGQPIVQQPAQNPEGGIPQATSPLSEFDAFVHGPASTGGRPVSSTPTITDDALFGGPPAATASANVPHRAVSQSQAAPEAPPLAFGGICIVSAVEKRKLVRGSTQFSTQYHGQLVVFGSQLEREQFLASPEKYWPMLDGICPVAFVESGSRKAGSFEFAAVYHGRIWLCSSAESLQVFLAHPGEISQDAQDLAARR